MGIEIERKFLLRSDRWRSLASGIGYRQGYITTQPGRTVRIRIAGDRAYLTIKGPTSGSSRSEYEYAIPVADAEEMLDHLCERPLIEKTRYRIPWGDLTWEVDEFAGENQGLAIAEIELQDEQQSFEIPDWIGDEVTHDPRYYNSSLVKHPFSQWST